MLKCVVTVIQNKRVALPFIFGKYCLPKMKEIFKGKIELYHIFHDVHIEDGELESNRNHGKDHLERVRAFIDQDMFSEAIIIPHQEINFEHFAVPSFIKAAEIAIRSEADFHLWIEDDAIILDRDCNKWDSLLVDDVDVGIYRSTKWQKMINCAFFLSNISFDKRILKTLKEYNRDNINDYSPYGSQLEHLLWRVSNNQVLLRKEYAERHHPMGKWAVLIPKLKKWLKSTIPDITQEHLNYLHLDFPE